MRCIRVSLWNSFRTPNETATSEKAFSALELWVVTSAKAAPHFFCCCCVLAQDLSIWRAIMNWLLLWTYKQLWQSTLRPLKALCAHSTIKKTDFDGSEGHLLWKEAASYYCVWFYCNLHFSMQNWIEPHNLANFNLIYSFFSPPRNKIVFTSYLVDKMERFCGRIVCLLPSNLKRRCFIWDTKHIFQNCTTKK